MLLRLKIDNFRSIRGLIVDFAYGEGKAPNGHSQSNTLFFLSHKKSRIVPCLAFYGANASGKSNILKAMIAFKEVVLEGLPRFDPNRLNPVSDKTSFELEFVFKEKTFIYAVSYDEKQIAAESLTCDGQSVFSIQEGKVNFSDLKTNEYPEKRLTAIYEVECCSEKQKRSVLSVLGDRYAGLNEKLRTAYLFFKEKIVILRHNNIPISEGIDSLSDYYAKEGSQNPLQAAFDTILVGLKKLDIDIENMHLQREKKPLQEDAAEELILDIVRNDGKIKKEENTLVVSIDQITSLHKDIHGKSVPFDFRQAESTGTQMLAGLLGVFYKALLCGQAIFIDELDRSIHPFLMREIIRLFKNKQKNQTNTQLIFTVHDTFLLEDQLLRVSEIAIVEKNLKKGTTIMRLCEDKKLRNVSNFKNLYLTGVYGGIPFPQSL